MNRINGFFHTRRQADTGWLRRALWLAFFVLPAVYFHPASAAEFSIVTDRNAGDYLSQGARVHSWGGLSALAWDSADFTEGNASLDLQFNGAGGFFYGHSGNATTDFSAFEDGYLRFDLKTTVRNFFIKIEAAGGAVLLEANKYARLDGNWERVEIPVTDFGRLPLRQVMTPFLLEYVLGAGRIKIDNVRYDSASGANYTILASAGANGHISPSGNVSVAEFASQTFSVTPDSGYAIDELRVDGVSVGAVNTYTFDTVVEDHSISASFRLLPVCCSITVESGAHGSISPGSLTLPPGASQSFSIQPEPGYQIDDVLVDGVSVGRVSTYTFANLQSAHHLSARFGLLIEDGNLARGRPVQVSSLENSSLLAANAVDGNPATRWASAFSDPQWIMIDLQAVYRIERVLLNWEAAYGRRYSIQVSGDAQNWVTIYSEENGNGGIDDLSSLSGAGRYIRLAGSARGTPWGYSLWEFAVFGSPAGALHMISVNSGANGSISPGSVAVEEGDSASFVIEADPGYGIERLLVDGSPVAASGSNATYTFSNVRSAHSLSASFQALNSNIALGKPAHYSSLESGSYSASNAVDGDPNSRWASESGDSQWISLDLQAVYNIERVVLHWETAYGRQYSIQVSNDRRNWTTIHTESDGDGAVDELFNLSGSGRYIRMLGSQRGTTWGYSLWEFEVYGSEGTPVYLVDVRVNDAQAGQVTPDSAVIEQGAGQEFLIEPAANHFIASVIVNGELVAENFALNESYRHTLLDAQADQTLAVTFGSDTPMYTISVQSGANGRISPGTLTLEEGRSQTFSIIPDLHYEVENVKVDGVDLGAIDSYSVENLRGNHLILVSFRAGERLNNIALGKSVLASSGQNSAAAAVDGASASRWVSAAGESQWLSVDLGGIHDVRHVILDWHTDYARSWRVQMSLNQSDWYDIAQQTAGSGGREQIGGLNASGRYIRVLGVQSSTTGAYSLSELEVYGTPSPAGHVISNLTDHGEHGRIMPGTRVIPAGQSYRFNVVPDPGYVIDNVYLDGQPLGAVSSHTLANVQSGHTLFAVFKLDGSALPYFNYEGFSLAVNDEFASYNGALWYRDWGSFEGNLVWYNGPNNIDFLANDRGLSKMRINLRREPSDAGRQYTSGQIVSNSDQFFYGRYETRMKIPIGSGFAATLFTFNTWNPQATWDELDIEVEGQYTDRLTTNVWRGSNTIAGRREYRVIAPLDSYPDRPQFNTQKWLIYSFDWLPDKVIFYINGQEIRRETRHVGYSNFHPAKVYMSLWITEYGSRFGGTNEGNRYPLTLEYDYFRYYRLNQ